MSALVQPPKDGALLPLGGRRTSHREVATVASRGFTLLEVLVALAILAVALIAGFRAVGLATGNAQELEERQLAEWVALNRLAGHRIFSEFLETGNYEGVEQQSSYEFRWKEEVKATPNALVRRTEVRVYRSDDNEHALAQLTGFMVKPLQ
jgi:general secretion pathway protein I